MEAITVAFGVLCRARINTVSSSAPQRQTEKSPEIGAHTQGPVQSKCGRLNDR